MLEELFHPCIVLAHLFSLLAGFALWIMKKTIKPCASRFACGAIVTKRSKSREHLVTAPPGPDVLKEVLIAESFPKKERTDNIQVIETESLSSSETYKKQRLSIRRLLSGHSCFNLSCGHSSKRPQSDYCYHLEDNQLSPITKESEVEPAGYKPAGQAENAALSSVKDGLPHASPFVSSNHKAKLRKKSFENEDSPIFYRTYTAPQSTYKRYSLAVPGTSDIPVICGSSVSLMGDDELDSMEDSFAIPRCASESNFASRTTKLSIDAKRHSSLKTFLQRRIPPSMRRAKNSKMNQGKENRPIVDITSLMAQSSSLRNAEVELPFFMPAIESPDVIDLSNCATEFKGALVRPLHHSILGKDYCFEVVVGETSRFFGCGSAGEREAWIEKIKRAIDPTLDNNQRMEYQLTLFVQEAKGVTTKKKYFGEICLDRKLCAKTTSKCKNNSTLFWGEQFEFSSMPKIQDVTVHLYKNSDKKKKKDKDYIGLVNLPAASLAGQQALEKWYTLSTPSGNNKTKTGEALALRIKANYLSIKVLPTDQYTALREHISKNYLNICRTLGNHISVARKGEIARTLVHIMHGTGHMKEYMTDVVMDEVEKVEEESLIFRENTIGTKSVEAMLRLVGMKYLSDTLGDFVHALFNMEEECEVDGGRLPPQASLVANQKNLRMSCDVALGKITASVSTFPSELREVMSSWRVKCEEAGRPRIANRLVTASLFLRLLCPAILNPSLFGLANEVPNTKVSRSLTLIAKVIQNLANRSRFGNKEEYMQFMDVFVKEKWDDMGSFISNVCDPSIPLLHKGFEGFIDMGKEFAKLHGFFVDVLPELDQKVVSKLGELPSILSEISAALDKPTAACSPSALDQVVEQFGAAHTTEDSQLSHDSDILAHPACCSSTPIIDGRSFLPTTGASSLLDLRDFINAHEDAEDGDVPVPSLSQGFFPLRQGSSPALPITCNFNNSNSTDVSWHRPTLTSSKKGMTGAEDCTPESRGGSPLMFSNPAYRVPKQQHCATQELLSFSTATVRQDTDDTNPILSARPVQAWHHQQLETVFTTETVTYVAPPRYIATSSPVATGQGFQSFSKLRCKPSPPGSAPFVVGTSGDIALPTRKSSWTSSGTAKCRSDLSSNASITNPIFPYQNNTAVPNVALAVTASYGSKIKASNISSIVPEHDPMEDSDLLIPTSSPPSISLAHPLHEISDSSQSFLYGTPFISQRGETALTRTALAPAVTSPISNTRNTSTRRNYRDEVRMTTKSEDCNIRPRPFLPQLSDDAVPGVTEITEGRKRHNDKESSSEPLKKQDELFLDPAPVANSRVMVVNWHGDKMKTSVQRTPCSRYEQHDISRSGAPVQGISHGSHLHATSESQLSPEARTAQWILSNVRTHGVHVKRENDVNLIPKAYEDRIMRLESEVGWLKEKLSENSKARRKLERQEAELMDKVRISHRRELKARKKDEAKEQQLQKVLQRLSSLETEQMREREAYEREKKRLEDLIEKKDLAVLEQQQMIFKLEGKLRLSGDFDHWNKEDSQIDGKSSLQTPLSFIDETDLHKHALHSSDSILNNATTSPTFATMTLDPLNFNLYCNGQLHYDDSERSSSSSM